MAQRKHDTMRRIARFARDRQGNVLVITAFCLMIFIAIVGSGVDIATAYLAKERMQTACDAGALAARQIMEGNVWTTAAENEGKKYFNFDMKANSYGSTNITFTLSQNASDKAEVIGKATASIPTNIMKIFGATSIPLTVECNAKRDLGNNDIMLVLDVTGSMLQNASGGGGTKISRLRTAAINLFKALADDNNSVTRFGIMPYSHTVNVAGSMANNDFLINQSYLNQCSGRNCSPKYSAQTIHIKYSSWGSTSKTDAQNLTAFQTSGDGCIEERTSYGQGSSNGLSPILKDTVTQDDIDKRSTSSTDYNLQFGRYDPDVQEGESQDGCPSPAMRLQEFASESDFQDAIDDTTARVTGGTYHDVGLIWGLRFLSGTGWFAADNPDSIAGVPVNRHIVFMTDGMLDTGDTLYSADGVQKYQKRMETPTSLDESHLDRFRAACQLAKQQATVWVIALDVGSTDDIEPCATSSSHFYISDGSDLATIFATIGQGIGNLRLTR